MIKKNPELTLVAILDISLLLTSATTINGALPQMQVDGAAYGTPFIRFCRAVTDFCHSYMGGAAPFIYNLLNQYASPRLEYHSKTFRIQ